MTWPDVEACHSRIKNILGSHACPEKYAHEYTSSEEEDSDEEEEDELDQEREEDDAEDDTELEVSQVIGSSPHDLTWVFI